jgi:hypothetical protein
MTEEKKQEALALIKGRVEEAHQNKYKDVTGRVYIDTLLDLLSERQTKQPSISVGILKLPPGSFTIKKTRSPAPSHPAQPSLSWINSTLLRVGMIAREAYGQMRCAL